MGFLARCIEKRKKLRHVRGRAAELLPLCEEATGIKLRKPLRIERSSRLRHTLRYVVDAVSGISRPSSGPLSHMPGPASNLRIALGLYQTHCLGSKKRHDGLRGYYDPERGILGMNLDHYYPGTSISDYVLAHEIVHALLGQHAVFRELGKSVAPGAAEILGEGGATYYGEMVAKRTDPAFDVSSHRSFKGAYQEGYGFFAAVASAFGDPIPVIIANPPGICTVRKTHEDAVLEFTDDEVRHPGIYLEKLARLPQVRSQGPS